MKNKSTNPSADTQTCKVLIKKPRKQKTPFQVGTLPVQPAFNQKQGELNATAFGEDPRLAESGAMSQPQNSATTFSNNKRPFKASGLEISSSFIRNEEAGVNNNEWSPRQSPTASTFDTDTWSSPAHSGTSTSPRLTNSSAVITPTKSELEQGFYGEILPTPEDSLMGESIQPLSTAAVAGLPQLNAMTLFAFHGDSMSNAFNCFGSSEQNLKDSDKIQSTQSPQALYENLWCGEPNSRLSRVQSLNSVGSSLHGYEEEQYSAMSNEGLFAQKVQKSSDEGENTENAQATADSLDSSGSSLDEILNTCMNNLENLCCSDSDESDSGEKNNTKRSSFFSNQESPKADQGPSNFSLQSQSPSSLLSGASSNHTFLFNQAPTRHTNGAFSQNVAFMPSAPQPPSIQTMMTGIEQSNQIKKDLTQLTDDEADIVSQIEMLAFDQAGCRMIQKALEEQHHGGSENFRSQLIQGMLVSLPDIMTNQFGNYLCQKVFEVCPDEDLRQVVEYLLPNIFHVSQNMHGTRAMQTLVEVLAQRKETHDFELKKLTEVMAKRIVELSMNTHGNHVIQAFLTAFRASEKPADTDLPGSLEASMHTQFIFDACITNCVYIGKQKHGCCVMQRCLEKGRMDQKVKLARQIISQVGDLIEDPYGNYLVQNVLKLEKPDLNEQIFQYIGQHFIHLSQLKFSSNVIEKCLESKQDESQIDKIFMGTLRHDDPEIVREIGAKSSKDLRTRVRFLVERLGMHQFGNYVLQKAVFAVKNKQLQIEILESIKLLSSSLVQTRHGPKVLQKLQKLFPQIFNSGAAAGSEWTPGCQSGSKGVSSLNLMSVDAPSFGPSNSCRQQKLQIRQGVQSFKPTTNSEQLSSAKPKRGPVTKTSRVSSGGEATIAGKRNTRVNL